MFLSAKTGAGVDLLQREILALADVHEDMEDTFLAQATPSRCVARRRGPSRFGAGALRRGEAAAELEDLRSLAPRVSKLNAKLRGAVTTTMGDHPR